MLFEVSIIQKTTVEERESGIEDRLMEAHDFSRGSSHLSTI